LFQESFQDGSLLGRQISELAIMIFGTIETKSISRDASSKQDDDGKDIHLSKSLLESF